MNRKSKKNDKPWRPRVVVNMNTGTRVETPRNVYTKQTRNETKQKLKKGTFE